MTKTVDCGAACVDITPPQGLAMSGFGARTAPADATHDPLTARALVIEDTAILVADVIGFDAAMSARIRARAPLPDDRIIIAALHNHGGPVSMGARLGAADADYLRRLEESCVAALARAASARGACALSFGVGADPGVGRNRRHAGGPVDRYLPVLRATDASGAVKAILVAYACHPVTLGADNTAWTADYPFYVRRDIEMALPGAQAIFLTAATGDVNTGHSAYDSMKLGAAAKRTFAEAERLGGLIARSALAATLAPLQGPHIGVAVVETSLELQDRDADAPATLARKWRAEMKDADAARRAILAGLIAWAERAPSLSAAPVRARVAALDWRGLRVIGLPGEPFVATALAIRAALARDDGDAPPAIVAGYCEDNPGYVPPAGEYAFGGYEVDDAHRLYGMRSPFAPGSAERLELAAIEAGRKARTAAR